ncbi:MAG: pitrilysin family protein [Gemmatimonadota bacterium]|nr:pitrilysin family protein [Gemmatimonadota bacterium]MDE2677902.1 pitrilysin family protein [Gemmatimonadota bacterium]
MRKEAPTLPNAQHAKVLGGIPQAPAFARALAFPLALAVALTGACAPDSTATGDTFDVPFERFELDNGLEVILHVDDSDPLAAVAMTFHVGSAREVEGRTGFAHLFEHLFFLDSENLGPGGLDRLMTRVGSSTNGSTSRDRTNYFEVVPIDGLEKTLWAEADKLGFFINTVTESVVAKEKQVVKNEKRQGVDNRPYGHNEYVIDRAMYPEGHPYRWQVIGSLADLDAATVADAKEFHARWYGPNNATLVVAGDIDVDQTMAWIEKYFGEIPSRPTPEVAEPPEGRLAETRRLYHEDNFGNLPLLTLSWPSVPRYHADAYALDVLSDLLTDGRSTPLYKVLVEEEELTSQVTTYHSAQELAGQFNFQALAFPGTDLDDLLAAVHAGFARLEEQGIPDAELQRVKAGTETGFYRGLSSAIGKAFQLADYAIFAGDPGYAGEDLRRILAVSAEDVMRVYETYLKDRPHVATSFVPRGQAELALEGSERAEVVIEPIVQGAEAEFTVVRGEERTPAGAFDRSVEPPYGASPRVRAPEVWRETLANGLSVLGVEDRETPMVQFELSLRGGMLLEEPGRTGVANLLAETMLEGTANRTPEELEQAIDLLGASLSVSGGSTGFTVSGSVLARNYNETMALVEEILLEPRFDPERFELARQRVMNVIRRLDANPSAIASQAFDRLLYGDHILARNRFGTLESVAAFTLDDLRAYHATALVPGAAAFLVAGAVSPDEATAPLATLAARWEDRPAPALPDPPVWSDDRAGLYFIDVPGAAQSVINVGRLALARTDDEYHPATVMNYRLGGGGFASDLTQVLREGKGYTYGVGSRFQGGHYPGPFSISTSVRSNVTLESMEIIRDMLETYGPTFDEEDLAATQGFLLRSNARAFETLGAKLGVVRAVSDYGFAPDYVLQQERTVREMTIERVRELAARHLSGDMVWLVVGDAATQLGRLEALGLGRPVVLDRSGRPVG